MDLSFFLGTEQTVGSVILSLILCAFTFWIAKKNAFFQLPQEKLGSSKSPVRWFYVLGAFAVFLVLAYLVLPLLLLLLTLVRTGSLHRVQNMTGMWGGWLQILFLFIIFWALVGYCFTLPSHVRRYVFSGDKAPSLAHGMKSMGMGVVAWLVSYPFVLLIAIITGWIAVNIWGVSHVEQEAVLRLKETMGHRLLFLAMIAMVTLLVPIMEEILFRGFLHNGIKCYWGRGWALALTPPIFALVHYATSQGYGNFQLILSLLVLSYFLSFIYERERSLWAPIALHVVFNTTNIALIIWNASSG